jgi:methylphosphotriester-DNA--protein-cysteine methyltransferase
VGFLSSRLEISRKHLIQLFRDQIGLPPKRAARLIRFNRVVELVQQNDSPDWADLAQCAGFFDQSHLINEVRRFTGKLPTELLRSPGDELAALAIQATAGLSR